MGCGGSTARTSTPVGVRNTQHPNENGRSDSAPVNETQNLKPARDLHSASTVVLGSRQSNTNLNNNNNPTNSVDGADQNASNNVKSSGSKIEIGQVIRTSISSDSVFIRNEEVPAATQTQESTVESQVSDTQTQESTIESNVDDGVVSPEWRSLVEEENTKQDKAEERIGGETSPQVPLDEDSSAQPPSNVSRREIDNCNSVTQLPTVIVRKSINAAVNRLSLQKDSGDNNEDGKEEGETAAEPQEDKIEIEEGSEKVPPSTPPNSTIDETETTLQETDEGVEVDEDSAKTENNMVDKMVDSVNKEELSREVESENLDHNVMDLEETQTPGGVEESSQNHEEDPPQ